jgi:predicted AlkP superfamily phosphohydrolase/phosphomutase
MPDSRATYRVVLVGLDGATFDVIKPMVAEGKLPNVAKLLANGVHGPLTSTIQPLTPQAWSSFATGKNAGKHGIYDFSSWKADSYELEFVNASHRRSESIFRLLSDAGKRVGSIGMPFTYPPEKVSGFMLSGIDAPAEDERAVYPHELYHDIKRDIGNYHIHLASPVGRKFDPDGFRRDMLTEDRNRTDVSLYLMERIPCDLFMTVYSNIDRAQHQFLCDGSVPEYGDFNAIVHEAYRSADEQLGKILSRLDEHTVVIVMSDHGAGPIRKVFYLNRWLCEQGLLEYKTQNETPFAHALQQARFVAKRFLPRWAKNFIKSALPGIRDKVESHLYFSQIDWKRTRAYGFGMYGNIFINLRDREPDGQVNPGEEYENVRSHIIEALTDLQDPDTGEHIIDRVYRREELYEGPYVTNAPDLLIKWRDYSYYTSVNPKVETGEIFGPCGYIDSSEYRHVGTHRLNGILIASGSIVRERAPIEKADIVDLAPTILHLFDQPIPEDMDGRVLEEMFTEEFLAGNPPRYREPSAGEKEAASPVSYSSDEEDQIRERLEGLGYLE